MRFFVIHEHDSSASPCQLNIDISHSVQRAKEFMALRSRGQKQLSHSIILCLIFANPQISKNQLGIEW